MGSAQAYESVNRLFAHCSLFLALSIALEHICLTVAGKVRLNWALRAAP